MPTITIKSEEQKDAEADVARVHDDLGPFHSRRDQGVSRR